MANELKPEFTTAGLISLACVAAGIFLGMLLWDALQPQVAPNTQAR